MTTKDEKAPTISPEEVERIKSQLEDGMKNAGWKAGQWGEAKGGTYEPKIVAKNKELLRKVRDLLEMQVSADLEKVRDLQEKAKRMKHGGGS